MRLENFHPITAGHNGQDDGDFTVSRASRPVLARQQLRPPVPRCLDGKWRDVIKPTIPWKRLTDNGRYVDPDEVDSRCVCKQLFSSLERDPACIRGWSRYIFLSFSPSSSKGRWYLFIIVPFLFTNSEYISFRREYRKNVFTVRCYFFFSLSLFFLNNSSIELQVFVVQWLN